MDILAKHFSGAVRDNEVIGVKVKEATQTNSEKKQSESVPPVDSAAVEKKKRENQAKAARSAATREENEVLVSDMYCSERISDPSIKTMEQKIALRQRVKKMMEEKKQKDKAKNLQQKGITAKKIKAESEKAAFEEAKKIILEWIKEKKLVSYQSTYELVTLDLLKRAGINFDAPPAEQDIMKKNAISFSKRNAYSQQDFKDKRAKQAKGKKTQREREKWLNNYYLDGETFIKVTEENLTEDLLGKLANKDLYTPDEKRDEEGEMLNRVLEQQEKKYRQQQTEKKLEDEKKKWLGYYVQTKTPLTDSRYRPNRPGMMSGDDMTDIMLNVVDDPRIIYVTTWNYDALKKNLILRNREPKSRDEIDAFLSKENQTKEKWINRYFKDDNNNFTLVTEDNYDKLVKDKKLSRKTPYADFYVKAEEEKRRQTAERAQKAAANRALKEQKAKEKAKNEERKEDIAENQKIIKRLYLYVFNDVDDREKMTIEVQKNNFKNKYVCSDLKTNPTILTQFMKAAKGEASFQLEFFADDEEIEEKTFPMMIKAANDANFIMLDANTITYKHKSKADKKYTLEKGNTNRVVYTKTAKQGTNVRIVGQKKREEIASGRQETKTTTEEDVTENYEIEPKTTLQYQFYNVYFHNPNPKVRKIFTEPRDKPFDQMKAFQSSDKNWTGFFIAEGKETKNKKGEMIYDGFGSLYLQDNTNNKNALFQFTGPSVKVFMDIFGFGSGRANSSAVIKDKIKEIVCKAEGTDSTSSSRAASPAESASSSMDVDRSSPMYTEENLAALLSDSDDEGDEQSKKRQRFKKLEIGASILAGVF